MLRTLPLFSTLATGYFCSLLLATVVFFFPRSPHSLPFWTPVFHVVSYRLLADFTQLNWFESLMLCYFSFFGLACWVFTSVIENIRLQTRITTIKQNLTLQVGLQNSTGEVLVYTWNWGTKYPTMQSNGGQQPGKLCSDTYVPFEPNFVRRGVFFVR